MLFLQCGLLFANAFYFSFAELGNPKLIVIRSDNYRCGFNIESANDLLIRLEYFPVKLFPEFIKCIPSIIFVNSCEHRHQVAAT